MAKVYVGNLPLDVKDRELEDLFYKFGKITNIDIKTPSRPPAYAFVEFDDPRDADVAISRRDNYDFDGHRIRVELARGGGGGGLGGGLFRESVKPPRPTDYRCIIKGLPRGASWQDLKDHMRRAARPQYTDVRVDRDGYTYGIVEFESFDDMRLAIKKLDDTEFRNPRYERGCYIRIVEENAGGGGGRSSSRRDRSLTPSRSPRRSLSRSASRSRSRSRSRSASHSRSRSRSRSRSPRGRSASPRRASPTPSHSRSRSRSRSHSRD